MNMLFAFILLTKVSALLAGCWIVDRLLAGSNPRWNVALWRSSALGVAGLLTLALAPPLFQVEVPGSQQIQQYLSLNVENLGDDQIRPASQVNEISHDENEQVSNLRTAFASNAPQSSSRSVQEIETLAQSDGLIVDSKPDDAVQFSTLLGWIANLNILAVIWSIGIGIILARNILGQTILRRILANAKPSAEVESLASLLKNDLPQNVRILISPEIDSPTLVGVFRPTVLIPVSLVEPKLDPESIKAGIAHEFTHLKHHDLVWDRIMRVTAMQLWFHPLAWPGPNALISFASKQFRNGNPAPKKSPDVWEYGILERSNASGQVNFSRAIPMDGTVQWRLIQNLANRSSVGYVIASQNVKVAPGEIKKIQLALDGTTAVGKIELPNLDEHDHEWSDNAPGAISTFGTNWSEPNHRSHRFLIDAEGGFVCPGLSPGKYELTVPLSLSSKTVSGGHGKEFGTAKHVFEISKDKASQMTTLNLGTIKATIRE